MTTPATVLPGALPEKAEAYRASFNITGPDATGRDLLARVETRVRDWLVQRSQEPETVQPLGNWSDDDYEISIERDFLGDAGYVSFKWECEDRRAPGLWLRLDVDLATEGDPVAVSIESYFLGRDDTELPDLLAGPPPLVHDLLGAFDCFLGEERLSGEVAKVSQATATEFAAGRILSPERRLPIVAVSENGRGETAVDPSRLQRVLAGLAVVATYGNSAAQVLRENVGPSLACYNGAVRVYWPACATGDRSGVHRVWMSREAARLGFRLFLQLQGECLRHLAPDFDQQMFESVKWRVDRENLRLRFTELEERERRLQEAPETGPAGRSSELELANSELKRQLALQTQEIRLLRAKLSQRDQPSPSDRQSPRIKEPGEEAAGLISSLDETDAEIRELKTQHSVILRRKEREIERWRQSFTNNEWVGTALRKLRDGLATFVSRKFIACYGNHSLIELQSIFQDDTYWHGELQYVLAAEQAFRDMDVAALLRVMSNRWHQAFSRTLDTVGPAQETLVRNLRDYRNQWAHQHNFSAGEAFNALDTMHRLLADLQSPQSDALEKLKVEHLREYPDARSNHRRGTA